MLSHVSKDQTIQYILVLIDDLLQEDRTRVQIFHDYANKKKESVWAPFLNLLNRQDGFIVNMASRVVGKLACWGQEQMPKSDLHFYLQWLKDQLTVVISSIETSLKKFFWSERSRLRSRWCGAGSEIVWSRSEHNPPATPSWYRIHLPARYFSRLYICMTA
ncbi:V-type proton ATPase subunit H-like isoform X1 [Anopheles merus]|uniref:V-type proton ATPase subunit H-like isoform X1 n=1 Tax=Anopheles merus TaxID=30066 RepID=UPI001BE4B13B|nr:V-type proton ATPase subunit H-like isoform X1 [Anopheles merus]